MLNNLPLEIILNITTFLTLDDKLPLIRTCKKLHRLISDQTLYHEVKLNCMTSRNSTAMKKFQSKKINGHQVKRLIIRSSDFPDDVIRNLAHIFPNVESLNEESFKICFGRKKSEAVLKAFDPWKYTLKRFHIGPGYSHLAPLIEKNTFPNLKYLCISPYQRYSLLRKPALCLFQCLENAPSLTHLRLYNMTVHTRFLEKLHSCCPQLRSLTLASLIINTKKDVDLISVEPVTQLTYFEIESDVIICDERCSFLDYLFAKYRHLEKLTFSGVIHRDWDDLSLDSPYTDDDECEYGYDDMEEFERNARKLAMIEDYHNNTQLVYLEEGAKRFSRLPSTLKELIIKTSIFKGLPEALEKADIQPKKLIFYSIMSSKSIVESLQEIECFQKWTLLTTLTITVNHDFNPRIGHLISDSVTTLRLNSSDEVGIEYVFVDRILASFPSLEDLVINHVSAGPTSIIKPCVDEFDTFTTACYPKLLSLYVRCSRFDSDVSNFLNHCVPNLQTLTLDIIVNRISWQCQKESLSPYPVHTIMLDEVKLKTLNVFFSTLFRPIDDDSDIDTFPEDESLKQTDGRAYLLVLCFNGIDRYTFQKDDRDCYKNFIWANRIEIDDISNRIQFLLSHTGTIKEKIIFGHILP